MWNKFIVQSQIKSSWISIQSRHEYLLKFSLCSTNLLYWHWNVVLKPLLLCLCSNPPSPLPLDVTPGPPQTDSVSTNLIDKYHIRHTSEPTRQESLTSLKNDLENHLEDLEPVSCFLCIRKFHSSHTISL